MQSVSWSVAEWNLFRSVTWTDVEKDLFWVSFSGFLEQALMTEHYCLSVARLLKLKEDTTCLKALRCNKPNTPFAIFNPEENFKNIQQLCLLLWNAGFLKTWTQLIWNNEHISTCLYMPESPWTSYTAQIKHKALFKAPFLCFGLLSTLDEDHLYIF